jgi:hypothetical protein
MRECDAVWRPARGGRRGVLRSTGNDNMQRIHRFIENTGAAVLVHTCIFLLLIGWALLGSAVRGTFWLMFVLLVVPFAAVYPCRTWLVLHYRSVRLILHGVVVIGVLIGLLSLWNFTPQTLWFDAVLATMIGTYLGCFFWMLSDPLMMRLR